LTKSR